MYPPVATDAVILLSTLDGAGPGRGMGAVDAVQSHVPGWLAPLVALVTQLGDPWFLAVVLVGLYWLAPRHREAVATVAGLSLSAVGLVIGLKHLFAFPRPDQPLVALSALPPLVGPAYELTGTASGYGFPSGHALVTTVVALGLVAYLPGRNRRRVAGALAVVGVVSLSRLALGVHYLVDVVAGVALGVGLLVVAGAAMERTPVDRPTSAFGTGVALAALAAVASAGETDAVLLVGAALGAFGGWQLVALGRTGFAVDRPAAAVPPGLGRAGLATAAAVPLWYVLEELPVLSAPWLAGALGVAVGTLVVVPVVRESDRTPVVVAATAFWAVAALRELGDLVANAGVPERFRPGRG